MEERKEILESLSAMGLAKEAVDCKSETVYAILRGAAAVVAAVDRMEGGRIKHEVRMRELGTEGLEEFLARDRSAVVDKVLEPLADLAGAGASPEERWWWAGDTSLTELSASGPPPRGRIAVRDAEGRVIGAVDVWSDAARYDAHDQGEREREAEHRAKQVLSAMRLAAALFDGPAGIERPGNPELAARGIREGAREHDLDAIAEILNSEEEAQDACARIADVLRQGGRDVDPDWNLGEEL